MVTVQLEKRGLPRFILNLHVEPGDGFQRVWRRGGVVRQGRLKPKRGATTRAWFRADAPVWRRRLGRSVSRAAEVVAECVALLGEVDVWWETEAASDHITVLEHRLRGDRGGTS